MRQLRLDKSSLHWRLATFYGPLHEKEVERFGTDICEYTRAVLRGMLVMLLIITVVSIGGITLADFLMWATAGLLHSFVTPELPAILFMVIVAFLTLAITWKVTEERLDEYFRMRAIRRQESLEEPKEPSFWREAYSAFKNKYCVKMVVKEQNVA